MSNQLNRWVRAYTNIAFIKYWGKEDETLIIPKNNSLSLTLDAFYTDTKVVFDTKLTDDLLFIDGIQQEEKMLKKAKSILNIVRERAGISTFAKVNSKNFVPTAAGLASSASGLAALAKAASLSAGLNLSDIELSRLARRGSGSASRSIYGGFVEWKKGTDDESSYAVQIDTANFDIGMLFIVINENKKAISSTEGMRRVVDTSPYYQGWIDSTTHDLVDIKQAIISQDVERIGTIAERSALKMHALNLSATPPFSYWSTESVIAMQKVKELRELGYDVFLTMDAGPNVKLICKASQLDALYEVLLKDYHRNQLVKARPGPGLQVIEKANH